GHIVIGASAVNIAVCHKIYILDDYSLLRLTIRDHCSILISKMTSRCCRSEDYRSWFRGPLSHLCSAYVLYYWGENMWQFALGLYLVHFEDGILRLVAIFGFAAAGSILLCGGLLGNW
ncbi:hypothetical protein LSH36_935g00091, partial [Paralvinella palmiformis]